MMLIMRADLHVAGLAYRQRGDFQSAMAWRCLSFRAGGDAMLLPPPATPISICHGHSRALPSRGQMAFPEILPAPDESDAAGSQDRIYYTFELLGLMPDVAHTRCRRARQAE